MSPVLCHVCKSSFPGTDFERGGAVRVLRRDYCGECAEEIATQGMKGTQRILRRLRSRGPAMLQRVLLAAAVLGVALVAILYAVLHRA